MHRAPDHGNLDPRQRPSPHLAGMAVVRGTRTNRLRRPYARAAQGRGRPPREPLPPFLTSHCQRGLRASSTMPSRQQAAGAVGPRRRKPSVDSPDHASPDLGLARLVVVVTASRPLEGSEALAFACRHAPLPKETAVTASKAAPLPPPLPRGRGLFLASRRTSLERPGGGLPRATAATGLVLVSSRLQLAVRGFHLQFTLPVDGVGGLHMRPAATG